MDILCGFRLWREAKLIVISNDWLFNSRFRYVTVNVLWHMTLGFSWKRNRNCFWWFFAIFYIHFLSLFLKFLILIPIEICLTLLVIVRIRVLFSRSHLRLMADAQLPLICAHLRWAEMMILWCFASHLIVRL
jgi:hypothetical protein